MKAINTILYILIFVLFLGCAKNKVNYELISTYQDHTIPELILEPGDSARVLIVVPHADDETIAGGLISLFREQGATIHLLTLCEHNETRRQELDCAAAALGIEKVEIAGFFNNPWDDIMQNNISFWYDHQDSIKNMIAMKIESFHPKMLVTFDSEIGGYGHPEHYISAQLTEDIFYENITNPHFVPEMIFQITLSEELEKFLVSRTPGYELTKKITGSQGLPRPDVSVDITNYWKIKNKAAKCHQSQLRTLKKFYVVYDDAHEQEHIHAFSREYYKIVRR